MESKDIYFDILIYNFGFILLNELYMENFKQLR